jgi:Taurine catabolism dioxygenase TauD, TfdA family
VTTGRNVGAAFAGSGRWSRPADRWRPIEVGPPDLPLDGPGSRTWLDVALRLRGAVLLRGFGVDTPERFARTVRLLDDEVVELLEESTPRTRLGEGVFTSTDYASDLPIQLHSEHSYAARWPMRLWFGCIQPADTGGQTMVADTREVLRHLPRALVQEFAEKGVLCERIFGPGSGISWSAALGVATRVEADDACRARGIEHCWIDDQTLRTRQRCAAVLRHPETGEPTWFNHALVFNAESIEPPWLREVWLREPPERRATNTYLGDGEPIDRSAIESIRRAYAAATFSLDWRRGDVLVLDNMLAAHGRRPYGGDRRIVVAMARPVHRSDVSAVRPAELAAARREPSR